MSLLIALLCLAVFLSIVFWLLGLVLNGAPPAARNLIVAIFALLALVWLFGGYSPFYHGHLFHF